MGKTPKWEDLVLNSENFDPVLYANLLVLKSPPLPIPYNKANGGLPTLIAHIDSLLTSAHKKRKLLLPNLHEHVKTVAVFSDYGGEHKGSQYYTYSYLFSAWDVLLNFFNEMIRIRTEYGLDNPYKEIAYKSLNYGQLQRALPGILKSAEVIPGIIVTVAISKEVQHAMYAPTKENKAMLKGLLKAVGLEKLRPKVAEKALRIAHIGAYFTALLAKSGHNVVWMTDHDDIAFSQPVHSSIVDIFFSAIRHYSPSTVLKKQGYALPLDRDPKTGHDLKDLLSLADLCAGAISSYFTTDTKDMEPSVKETTNTILEWLCTQGLSLKNLMIKCESDEKNQLKCSLVSFDLKNPDPEAKAVPAFLEPS